MGSSLLKASEIFKTSFATDEYFESVSASYVKNSIINSINARDTSLMFLLGEPGVGKTYMLNIIKEEFILSKRILVSSEPFSTPEAFLFFLLRNQNVDRSLTISELKEKAINYYKNQENLIILDEAQLLNDMVMEFIRILSDTGYFVFILSMHKAEGEKILKKQHFLTRPHLRIDLDKIDAKEMLKYIHAQLLRHSMGDLCELFNIHQTQIIYRYSKGNFRTLKQMVKHIFSIIDYAKSNGYKAYATPNRCVITMSAIDLGILNV